MKILMLTPCVPTVSDGRRPYNFLRYLSSRHEVHLLCFKLPPQTKEDVRRVQNMGVKVTSIEYQKATCLTNCALGISLARPFRVSWCKSTEFRAALERMLSHHQFDVVHIDRMRIGQYAPLIEAPKLLDFTDSLVLYLQRSLAQRRKLSQRFIDFWELKTIPRFERWLLERCDASLLCSTIDADVFQQHHPERTFDVIENAVDAEQFKPKMHGTGYNPKCILTGTLFYFANIDSVLYYREDILPLIREKYPEMQSQVIGTRPTNEIKQMNGRMGVQIMPDVPNMADCLYQDDIYVCPLRVAAGVRNKLLEAMSAGMPVVTTRLGAEGLDLVDGKEALFAETPQEFLQCIQKVMESPDLRQRLAEHGRQYVQTHHNLDRLGQKLENLYQRIIDAHQ